MQTRTFLWEKAMTITTKRTISTLIGLEDAAELSSYYLRNENHLRPFEPIRSADYNSLTAWKTRAEVSVHESAQGCAYRYATRLKNDPTIIATVNFTNVFVVFFKPVILVFLLMKNSKTKVSCSRFYLL